MPRTPCLQGQSPEWQEHVECSSNGGIEFLDTFLARKAPAGDASHLSLFHNDPDAGNSLELKAAQRLGRQAALLHVPRQLCRVLHRHVETLACTAVTQLFKNGCTGFPTKPPGDSDGIGRVSRCLHDTSPLAAPPRWPLHPVKHNVSLHQAMHTCTAQPLRCTAVEHAVDCRKWHRLDERI